MQGLDMTVDGKFGLLDREVQEIERYFD